MHVIGGWLRCCSRLGAAGHSAGLSCPELTVFLSVHFSGP
ncbi:hypothetical protein CSUI_010444 [Cystoisospora suis]|uniref:Uncharacterized protein n=1 Tax=Cystoisospora suis TaxID=483139 RepID=A0A2C6KH76_9APIC|nr:hypothetical protein CSUI_010444 [Cystoisospora suis]